MWPPRRGEEQLPRPEEAPARTAVRGAASGSGGALALEVLVRFPDKGIDGDRTGPRRGRREALLSPVVHLPELHVEGGARDPQRLGALPAMAVEAPERLEDRLALHLGERPHLGGSSRAAGPRPQHGSP